MINYLEIKGNKAPIRRYNTVVIGSGAAGFNAADSLYNLGMRDVAIVTEGVGCGTSRNAGSDKQTYYKLTLGGGEADSVAQMAGTLYGGGSVDGDTALCEAGLSAECFFKLASLGVPFPRNRYGGWDGYKTDHDPKRRATSAGPYTSRLMTEKLHEAVKGKGIPIYDRLLAIKILTRDAADAGDRKNGVPGGREDSADAVAGDRKNGVPGGREAAGVLCLDLDAAERGCEAYVAFNCNNIILATGGPAGIYRDTVYPAGHHGSNGLAFEAGAPGANLTEWQFGLASLNPRWNVSGTYMQALPRFISTNPDGGGGREFLTEYFPNWEELLTNVFLKGYQWPFDSKKAIGGSSLIDLCVARETQEGRRVWLDFRENPGGGALDFNALGGEAAAYLKQAGACFGSPIDRLRHMNAPAVDFYLGHGVNLSEEPLEIAVCAQHNNGGVAVNRWWQTRVRGLFAAGEAAATHGVRRPGGSALNAGQAGSLRAAQFIAARRAGPAIGDARFIEQAAADISESGVFAADMPGRPGVQAALRRLAGELRAAMSGTAGAVRNAAGMREALARAREAYETLSAGTGGAPDRNAADPRYLPLYYMARELCVSQILYLSAFIDYAEKGGKSRGGAIYTDAGGTKPHALLPGQYTFTPDGGELDDMIQEAAFKADAPCAITWRKRRPIPAEDDFFENVWRDFREGRHIDDEFT